MSHKFTLADTTGGRFRIFSFTIVSLQMYEGTSSTSSGTQHICIAIFSCFCHLQWTRSGEEGIAVSTERHYSLHEEWLQRWHARSHPNKKDQAQDDKLPWRKEWFVRGRQLGVYPVPRTSIAFCKQTQYSDGVSDSFLPNKLARQWKVSFETQSKLFSFPLRTECSGPYVVGNEPGGSAWERQPGN